MESGIRRRDFFKAIATGGAAAAAAAGCDTTENLIPFLVPPSNVEFIPGIPLDYATTCMECPANCGMIISTREGRAIKAEGNPDHPVSQGALCARGQASLQTQYNPERIRSAMQRNGNLWEEAPQDRVEKTIAQKIKGLRGKRELVFMTDNASGSRGAFLDAWLSSVGASEKIVLDPLELHSIREANQKMFRRNEIPQYKISEAKYLLNFGSEFLETWISPVEQNREFVQMHALDEQKATKGKFVHVGPHVSMTGANADLWISIAPGSETEVILALTREVMSRTKRRLSSSETTALNKYLKPYTLNRAAASSGADAGKLKKIAKEFASASPSLALAGGNVMAGDRATEAQMAVNLLNYVAGNMGKTILFGASRSVDQSTPFADVMKTIKRMETGEVKVLILDGANPLYSLAPSTRIAEALAKVDTIVSLSSLWDETTRKAHYALPGQTFFERWGDASPRKGIFSLIQPVMTALYPVKAAEDTLLSLSVLMNSKKVVSSGKGTYRDYLREKWQKVQKNTRVAGDFETFWMSALQKGGLFQEISFSSNVRLDTRALSQKPARGKIAGEGLVLLPTASLRHRDGRTAAHPWMQEVPDPVSQVVWDSWADINPKTAKKMGIVHGEKITVKSPYGSVELAAFMHYGIHEDAISIPMGQGHTDAGRTANHSGVNVMELLPPTADKDSGAFAFVSTRVQVTGSGESAYLAHTDGSPRQGDRGIIQTTTVAQFAKGEKPQPAHGAPHGEKPSFYPPRADTPGYYDPYKWGMVVDSDRCTGCSACVVACYAENNIPVVGKERTALGREMSWMRVERFIEGEGDDYNTLMQPMFCQQCENAGCEPVCPVYATYHTPEGLNAQVYNRCVGTRYCLNNCAYKVRRFNYFNYEFEAPLNLQLNPDVTVRSKGVMEKCTFCVQRIKRTKETLDKEGRMVADGDITPACVQTCPTNALTFGNMADPNSQVSKKAKRQEKRENRLRQYEVLEELMNKPGVTYLRKVKI